MDELAIPGPSIALSGTIPSGTNCVAVPPDLVSWWRAEGDARDALGGNHGELVKNVGFAPGKVGTGFLFGGSNHVQVPYHSSLTLTNEITIEFWYKNFRTGDYYYGFIANRGQEYQPVNYGVNVNYQYGIGPFFDDPNVAGGVNGNTFETSYYSPIPTTLEWHHFAVTYRQINPTNVELKTFINGQLVKTGVLPGNLARSVNTYPLTIGVSTLQGGDFFQGIIDEMSLYKRALTTEEIQGIFAAGSAGKCVPPPPVQCAAVPQGLVGWWPGEGNTADVWDGNPGVLSGTVPFTAGKVGQAFVFGSGHVRVPASSNLNVGAGPGLTVETWIKPNQVLTQRPLVEWNNGSGFVGTHIWMAVPLGQGGAGSLFANLIDASGANHQITSPTNLLVPNAFQHIALTYDKPSGLTALFVNGTQVAQTNLGTFTPYTSSDIYFGVRPSGNHLGPYQGAMDEVSIYSRALTTQEIQSIVEAGSAGKCLPERPPVITSQPLNRSAIAGETVTFSVGAEGPGTLLYQWRFNASNLVGATNSWLTMTNVQPTNAGSYSVLVANAFGSVESSDAVLTVEAPPLCVAPPAGLVGWWSGEGNADDVWDGNPGVVSGSVPYTAGRVGQAFVFGSGHVRIPASPSLNVGAGPGLTLEAWVKPNQILTQRPLFEWNNGSGFIGAQLWFAVPWSRGGAGSLFANLIDVNGQGHAMTTGTNLLVANVFQHVALTYDKASGLTALYVNGVQVAQTNLGSFTPYTTSALYLGVRPSGSASGAYQGSIDEASVYARALTAQEIQSISSAGAAGKCPDRRPPVITEQPQSRSVMPGESVTFSVGAEGSGTLLYQWRFNASSLVGATRSSLTMTNVQPTNAGSYSVLVANAFGSVESSDAVLTVEAPPLCVAPPAGLVGWWPGEGNANDVWNGNPGVLSGSVPFTPGKVGQAFVFGSGHVRVPASSNLNVGAGPGLTVETWIKPNQVLTQRPLVEWNDGGGFMGTHIWMAVPLGQGGAGSLFANLVDASGANHQITSPTNLLVPNAFQHIALTYDKTSGLTALFVNGTQVAQTNLGTFTPYTSSDIYFGVRPSGNHLGPYQGLMDEVSIYSRALTAQEVQSIFVAGSTGKCPDARPPVITAQPQNRSAIAGETVTFSVGAEGPGTLLYQWRFNASNIVGATSSSLTITNVQPANAGTYSVLVANAFGFVVSSDATLEVNQLPVAKCLSVTVPADSNCLALVSVDNGSFDPDGDPITVSQVPPGPYPLGTNPVFLVVTDSRGASNVCAAIVVVADLTPPQIVCPDNIVVTNAHDAWTSAVTYAVAASDNCSDLVVSVEPPSGSEFPLGTTTVQARAVDGAGNVASCTFTVTVVSGNSAPVPVIEVSPLAKFAGWTNLIVISPNGTNAAVVFDGSKSHDLDDTNIAFAWFEGTNLFGAAKTATNTLPVGSHEIVLRLDDGYPYGTNRASVVVEVISAGDALEVLADMITNSSLGAQRQHDLLVSIYAAGAAVDHGVVGAAIKSLQALQSKVLVQVAPADPQLATDLITAAQSIIDALKTGYKPDRGGRLNVLPNPGQDS